MSIPVTVKIVITVVGLLVFAYGLRRGLWGNIWWRELTLGYFVLIALGWYLG